MFTFLVILTVISWLGLVLVAAIRPLPSLESLAELTRRARRSGKATEQLRREHALPDILALQRIMSAVLIVVVCSLSIVTYGWFLGIVAAILGVLCYGAVASWGPVASFAMRMYERAEPWLVTATGRAQIVLRLLRGTTLYDTEAYRRIDSRDELIRLVEKAGEVFSEQERALLRHTLEFHGVLVSAAMTPRSAIKSIGATEFLGPLVLSELHDTGHSRLPVIQGDLDHVVGILYTNDLLSLDVKRSVTAEKAMDKKVYYIRHDDTLEHALGAFLRTHHHLFVVINDARETVGLLSLEDVIEMLLGRNIIDEDDIHADKSAVAKNPRNNTPPGHVDV